MKLRAMALALTCNFCFLVPLFSWSSSDKDKAMLTVSIDSDRREYTLTQEVRLDVRVTNCGTEPLTIYGHLLWGDAGGLTLHITDESNKEIVSKLLDDDLLIPSTLLNRNSFVVLLPNHFLGTTRVGRTTDFFEKPGTYFIRAEYRSPVPSKFGQGPNFWSFDQPPVSSKPIQVHVSR